MINFKYAPFALGLTLMMAYASSIPEHALWGNKSPVREVLFNFAHIPSYALLTVVWLKTFERPTISKHWLVIRIIILMGLAFFAFLDEMHQSYVPGRTADCLDAAADLLGILIGALISPLVKPRCISAKKLFK